MMAGANIKLSKWIRLTPIPVTALPYHPDIHKNTEEGQAPPTEGSSELALFLEEVLAQAQSFVDGLDSESPRKDGVWQSKGSKSFTMKSHWKDRSRPPTTSVPIEILARHLSTNTLKSIPGYSERWDSKEEDWFARRSIHENISRAGSATFQEFKFGIKDDHSKHEAEYTDDLYQWKHVLQYPLDGVSIPNYSELEMYIVEMCHEIPFPLKNRMFPELVITANSSETSFIVVQLPLEPKSVTSLAGSSHSGDSNLVVGAYASIERVRQLKDGKLEWTMAVTSDAKGNLPGTLQKMSLPGAIAKDVGLYLNWINVNSAERKDEDIGMEPRKSYNHSANPKPRVRSQYGSQQPQ